MSRRSRKDDGSADSSSAEKTSRKIWKCGIYARLSSRDNGHDGDSIQAQMDFVSDALEGRDDIQVVGMFSDNGRTGTTFKGRIEFERLMDEVRARRIDCIAVKDLSRFGRNAYETGTYLEKIFPFLGVRFLAINDHLDTLEGDGGIMVGFKGLVNELYAQDTSRKVGLIKRRQAEAGRISYGAARYGYRINQESRSLIPDEETAPFVKLMFQWAAQGVSPSESADRLNQMKAPTPMDHRNAQSVRGHSAYHADTPWKSHAVSRILDDAVYSGQLVLNKTHCSFANRQPNAQVPPEERLVFADAHPAIVDRETFEKVSFARQEMQKDKRKCLEATASKREAMPDILSGYLRCGYCGGAMMLERRFNKGERRGSVYLCRKHKRKGCPNAARIPERLVRLVVADSIRVQIDAATAFEKVLPGLVRDPRVLAARTRHEEGITALERKVRSLESKCARMYEDYAAGSLCVDEYKIAKMEAVRHTRDAAAALARAKGELASFEAALSRSDGALCASRSFAELHTLSPELLEAMVKRIEVGSDGGIAIEFVFEDWVGVVDRVWKEIS